MRLRLLDEMELAGDPARCVELTLPEYRNSTVVAWRLRLTPADVIRLRMETDLLMGEIRAEVLGAVIARERQLGHWYEEGRVAVEAQEPDVALLRRALEGLRSTLQPTATDFSAPRIPGRFERDECPVPSCPGEHRST